MSDDGGLGPSGPVAAEPGPKRGVGGPIHGAGYGAGVPVSANEEAWWQQRFAAVPEEQRQLRLHAATPYYDPPLRLPARGADHFYFEESVSKVFDQLEEVLLSKHRDYGPRNIADAPGGALYGLQIRIHDKVARINHLLDKEVGPENESLEDSFLDLANYAAIAVLVLRKQWPA